MVNNIFKVIRSLFVGLWGNKSSSVYEKNSTWIEEESFVLCCDKVVKRAVSLNISCVNKLASKDLLMEYIKNENELYRFWCFLDVYIINIKQVPNISCFFFCFFFFPLNKCRTLASLLLTLNKVSLWGFLYFQWLYSKYWYRFSSFPIKQ